MPKDPPQNTVVAVRCRPFNSREIALRTTNICKMEGKNTIVTDPKTGQKHTFTYDYSYMSFDKNEPGYATQEIVFNDLGQQVVDNALQGYNNCIFAYGQTGSGKTYSIMGYGEEVGIVPRLCMRLIEQASAKRDSESNWNYKMEVSFIEIYNEKVRDLLNPKAASLRVREHPVTGPYVEGVLQLLVSSYDEISKLLDQGNKARTVAATSMNATSSRSHSIFTLVLTMIRKMGNEEGNAVSKINLVDLAGSERADKTEATGDTLREGANINKSLSALGKVISELTKGSDAKHIPYRESTLTWLLRENLGGNSKTIMLAAISPAGDNYEETVSTLRYAERAKRIVLSAVVNEDPKTRQIRELQAEIELLRKQLSESGGQSSGSLVLQLEEAENILAGLNMSWDDKARISALIQRERMQTLEKMGLLTVVNKELPRLVNLNEDPLMDAVLVYYLKPGETLCGKGGANIVQDFVLLGDYMQPTHCIFVNEGKEGEVGVVTVRPAVNEADVRVNGHLIDGPVALQEGDRVILGSHHLFRFSHPQAARQAGATTVDWKMAVDELAKAKAEDMANEIVRKKMEELERAAEAKAASRLAELESQLQSRANLDAQTAAQEKLLEEQRRLAEQAKAERQAGWESLEEKLKATEARMAQLRAKLAEEPTPSQAGGGAPEVADGSPATSPRWKLDKDVKDCEGCHKPFGMMRRRHHCRICGGIFCNYCSSSRVPISDTRGGADPQRACNKCVGWTPKESLLPSSPR